MYNYNTVLADDRSETEIEIDFEQGVLTIYSDGIAYAMSESELSELYYTLKEYIRDAN